LTNSYTIYTCGDHAVSISFGNIINRTINEKLMSLYKQLIVMEIDGVKDIISAYTTLTVVYDIEKIKQQTEESAYSFISHKIEDALKETATAQINKTLVEIPVCYDKDFAPDLERISEIKQLSIDEIINIHTSETYYVYMLGFLPGFAYMGSIDEKIATPRLEKPRINIAAGSVGIAGHQTGIYPLDSPGGWNIIGRTPLALFDATREQPCLLAPGNMVKFVPISKATFEQLKHEHPNY
jgi:inhibitor of KinA